MKAEVVYLQPEDVRKTGLPAQKIVDMTVAAEKQLDPSVIQRWASFPIPFLQVRYNSASSQIDGVPLEFLQTRTRAVARCSAGVIYCRINLSSIPDSRSNFSLPDNRGRPIN